MLAIVMKERDLTTTCLKHHLHRQRQYSSDITTLLTSINRQRQKFVERTRSNGVYKKEPEDFPSQHVTTEDTDYFMIEEEDAGVIDEEDSSTATDNPSPLDEFPLPSHETRIFGLTPKKSGGFSVEGSDIMSRSSTTTHVSMESDALEGDDPIGDSTADPQEEEDGEEDDNSFARETNGRKGL